MTEIPLPPDTSERLLAHRLVTETGCWEWTRYRNQNGYGKVSVAGHLWTTHRLAAALWLSDFALDLHVCHRCDNPPCFNHEHLFMGTHRENLTDAIRKGRLAGAARESLHPIERPCVICGTVYLPDADHRGRSKVCSADCLGELRSRNRRGQGSKFTEADVRTIKASDGRGVDLAAQYGVAPSAISRIRSGKRWGHVA